MYLLSCIDRTNIAMAIPAMRAGPHMFASAIGQATSVFFRGYVIMSLWSSMGLGFGSALVTKPYRRSAMLPAVDDLPVGPGPGPGLLPPECSIGCAFSWYPSPRTLIKKAGKAGSASILPRKLTTRWRRF